MGSPEFRPPAEGRRNNGFRTSSTRRGLPPEYGPIAERSNVFIGYLFGQKPKEEPQSFAEQRQEQLNYLRQDLQETEEAVRRGGGKAVLPYMNSAGHPQTYVATPETVFGMKVAKRAMEEDLHSRE